MSTIEAETDKLFDEPDAKKPKLDVEAADLVSSAKQNDGNETSASLNATKFEQEIIDQVEYYFGDANLFRDKFLQSETTKNDGWIPLSTLITFKRLAALSTDPKVIVDALDKSESGLLEINDSRDSIRRHPERPLPEKNEETRKEIISRSAYVKGFSTEMEMPELLDFFKDYPKVSHLVIRKYLDKPTKIYKSKGSVFVTFNTRDQCAAFLSQDVKYQGVELITLWQSDYYANKKTERQEKQKEKNAKLDPEIQLPKGAILIISNIKPDVTRELIKSQIETMGGDVAFVDFAKGDEKAYVRINKENGAKELVAKLEDGKMKLDENTAPVTVLDGEAEDEYLAKCVEKIKQRRQNCNKKKHNSRK